MSAAILWFSEIGTAHAGQVGGKGLNLGLMTAAGLPVPPGFVIPREFYRASHGVLQPEQRSLVLHAYQQLGGGPVAVRSSALGEDGAEFSFAGQQETILGVTGDVAVLDAVQRCWQSLHSERAIAYRRANHIDEASVSMAVLVQRLVPAEVSGVLFTHDPTDASQQNLLIEAAFGLGEGVVSGRVTPDRFHVDRSTGRATDSVIATKREELTTSGWIPVADGRQQQPSLSTNQISELAKLAERIENYYGEPRDVEWAYASGQFSILQARPITAVTAAEIAKVRREEIERARQIAGGREVIWARYNLAEVLPTPTPLTWSIIKRFMSGKGGFGQMFRSLGYDPDPELDDDGFIDLICGRPYINLDREPKLFFRDFPYGYDFAAIRDKPELGMYPKLTTVSSRKTSRFWWRLPMIAWRMVLSTGRIKSALKSEDGQLTERYFAEFKKRVIEHRQKDLAALEYSLLTVDLIQWIMQIDDFACHTLRPGVLAATALAELEQLLSAAQVSQAAAVARQLVIGVRPPAESDLAGAVQALRAGRMTCAKFVEGFGHRGPQEMELAQPRWSEIPDELPTSRGAVPATEIKPVSLGDVVNLQQHSALRPRLESALERARTYLALRESSKHHLMLGFERLRAIFRQIGRRIGIGDDIFYLTLSETGNTHRPPAREDLLPKIKANKCRRQILLSLPTPPVLFSDDLEAIGRPIPVQGAAEWNATPLSFGEFEGPALVLDEPVNADTVTPGFVLVCPSTDPAWVPLFLKAGALVMESGGVLSHGAIVAREFGIPAVAGIANVHRRLRTGQRLKVDGSSGKVHVFDLPDSA
jgi:pyruvate,water dikinase